MASRTSSPSEGEVFDTHKANNFSQYAELPINDSDRIPLEDDGYSDYAVFSHQNPENSPPPFHRKPAPSRSRSPSPYRRSRDGARSRSPFRHGRGQNKRKGSPLRGGRSDKRQQNGRTKHNDRVDRPWSRSEDALSPSYNNAHNSDNHVKDKHRPKPISYAEIENPNSIPNFSNSLSADRRQHHSNDDRKRDSIGPKSSLDVSAPKPKESIDIKMGSTDNEPEYTLDAVEDKQPTQESREEKKRRWAALRAAAEGKAKNPDSLLQQALTNASDSATPNVPSPRPRLENSASPTASPRLGYLDSDPGSPDVMIIDKQVEFSERNSPSAADYDPTKDMLDDRDRAALKAQQLEVSSDTYKETDPKALSILPATKALPVKKQKKEFDMFASDDEDEDELEEPAENTVKGTVLDEKLLDNWDDKDHYYKIINQELVDSGRYRMIKSLGRGVYANVAQAEDVKTRKLVAIKIIRRNAAMRNDSLKEIEFLRKANDKDPQDSKHIIRLLDSFDHKGHLCIVFEHMSKNLRDLLKEETNGHGLTLSAVRTYSRQMFTGLKHLQDCQILHLDLKPDNILVSLDNKTVKLADFGTAKDQRDNIDWHDYLVSRFYRAPEIILGMEFGYGVDIWAIGCTMYELWTGKILFTGRSNNQMIKAFIDCLGWPSEKLLKKGQLMKVLDHFEAGPPLKFISREVDMHNKPSVRKIEQQKKIRRDLKTRVHDAAKNIAHEGPTTPELNDFVDLLSMTLNLNPDKRCQPRDALAHRFISKQQTHSRSTTLKPAIVRRGTPGTSGTFPIRR